MHDWNRELAAHQECRALAAHGNQVWLGEQSNVTVLTQSLQIHLKIRTRYSSKQRGGTGDGVVAVHKARVTNGRTWRWLNVHGLERRAARRLHASEDTVAADDCTRSKFAQCSAACLCDPNFELHLLDAGNARDIHPTKSGRGHEVPHLNGGAHISHSAAQGDGAADVFCLEIDAKELLQLKFKRSGIAP